MSVYLLKTTLEALESGGDLSQECRDWLLSGFGQYYLKGNHLEQLLGLKLPGQPGSANLQPLAVDKLGRRNKLIQDLARQLPGDNPLARSKEVIVMIRHYPLMADEYGETAEYLIRKLMADHRGSIPKSLKQINRIVSGEAIPDLISSGHQMRVCVPDPFRGKFPPTQSNRGSI